MSVLIRVTDKDTILQYLNESINDQKCFYIWDDLSQGSPVILKANLTKIPRSNNLIIKIYFSNSEEEEYIKKTKKIRVKDDELGIFFKARLTFKCKNEYNISIPKILNLKNTRFKERQAFGAKSRFKVSGHKQITQEARDSRRFTANIYDFHFNGMSLIINSKDLNYFSVDDEINITRVDNLDLPIPIIGNIRYIKKISTSEGGTTYTFYRIGIFIKEKIPASVIFLLTKNLNDFKSKLLTG